MKGTLAIAAREVAERKLVFLGAFVAGLLPLAFPLLPASRGNAHDARSVAMLLLATTIAVAFPLVFGATILVGDIAQKRLAFYFSRPLPASSIWAGKLLGAFLISIGCATLAAAPVFFLEGERAFSLATGGLDSRGLLVLVFPGVLLLLLLAHVAASMARLRSVWIVFDFFTVGFAFALFAVDIDFFVRSLFFESFGDLHELKHSPERSLWWLAVALIAILLAATYVQVQDGRTDARRSHGALSATISGLTAVFLTILGGVAAWAASARATELANVDGGVLTAPRGTWVAAGGPLRLGRGAGRFLFDTESGRSVRIRSGGAVFSASGARAAWTEERVGFFERGRKSNLFVADLVSAKAVETGLTYTVWCRVVLSPSGSRLAVLDGNTLAAYDVTRPDKPQQLAAFRLEGEARHAVFVDEDVIRLFPRFYNAVRKDVAQGALEITELSLPSKKSSVSGRFERETLPFLRLSADGRFLVGAQDKRLTLHDGRTGALLSTLSSDLESPKMRFLSEGRMVVAGISNGKGFLKVLLEGERAPALSIELGPATSVILGGEITPGSFAVALSPFHSNDERSRRAWKLALVDVATGAVSSGPDGLVPADRFSSWFSPTLSPAEAGSPASKLFLNASGALVRLDPATGAQTVLLGGSK